MDRTSCALILPTAGVKISPIRLLVIACSLGLAQQQQRSFTLSKTNKGKKGRLLFRRPTAAKHQQRSFTLSKTNKGKKRPEVSGQIPECRKSTDSG